MLLALLAIQVMVEVPVVDGNLSVARGQALDQALKQCVVIAATQARPEAAVPTEVEERARSYVRTYRILEEGEVDGLFRLAIEADVASGRLTRDLGPAPDPSSPSPIPLDFVLSDEGTVRGTGLFAARARAKGGSIDVEAFGFGSRREAARAAAQAEVTAQARAYQPQRGFDLWLVGIRHAGTLARLRDALSNRVAGVTTATLGRATRGRFLLRVVATRSPAEIAYALAGLRFEEFLAQVQAVGTDLAVEIVE